MDEELAPAKAARAVSVPRAHQRIQRDARLDQKGLHLLAQLLAAPHPPFHVLVAESDAHAPRLVDSSCRLGLHLAPTLRELVLSARDKDEELGGRDPAARVGVDSAEDVA